MQAQSSERPTTVEKPSLPMPVIIGVIVLLIAVVGFIGWKNFGPQPQPNLKTAIKNSNATPEQKTNRQYLVEMAEKYKGDFSKASPEEQKRIQEITHGFGAQTLKAMAR